MAKRETLSLDELLERALVKAEDKPCNVPNNWLHFYFTSLIDIQGGTQPPKSQFVSSLQEGYVRLVQIRDFASYDYIVYIPAKDNLRYFEEKDILIARYGASLGRICTGLSGACNVALAKTIFPHQVFHTKFMYWLLNSEWFQNPLLSISRTAQAGFNKEDLSGFKMPLPPLSEQQRIVDLIELLFEKLDRAKELVQNVLDSFEERKLAILHKAFTGDLTAKWRKENGLYHDEEWKIVELEKVAIAIDPHPSHRTPASYESGIPYIGIAECNYRTLEIDFLNARKVSPNVLDEHISRYNISDGDFIIGKIGTIGKPFEIPTSRNYVLSANVILIQAKKEHIIPKYMFYMFQSSHIETQLLEGLKATTQAAFGIKKVRKIKLNYCSIKEQEEIVRILDNLLENEQRAKKLCDVIDNIVHMKKSILARAFRGELSTNNPNEESSLELLKEVLRERVG
ncbi:restriction endonuclease subunit S [Desulfosporosinus nitroreducens]|uniref:Restriction endonuclease subunit S n=1 Tax=Desulfosporosinus nitroreducens TaxID=2018668 RepID=A0ABT8QL59_9FIRM|nr:restriction endonuclease subunit S [Desulfosporosinus nitroreducens]MDO0821299.1 restriction endonuclease subunit S [Desulfosporosinus nitroreducens]